MLEKLKESRELLLWGAAGSVAFLTLMGVVHWIYQAARDGGTWRGSSLVSGASVIPVIALVVAVLALGAAALVKPVARNVALSSLILLGSIAVGFLVQLVALLIVLFGEGLDGATKVIYLFQLLGQWVVVAVLALVVLRVQQGVAPAAQPGFAGAGQPQFGGVPGQVAPGQQPTWQPGQASGGGWNRAGDAASGASASTWGTPGQQAGGWQQSQQPAAQQPAAQQPAVQPGWGQSQPSAAQPPASQPAWGQAPAGQGYGAAPAQPAQHPAQPSWQPSEPAQPGWGQPQAQQENSQQENSWQSQSAQSAASDQPASAQSAEEGTVLRPAPPQTGGWSGGSSASSHNPNPGQWQDGQHQG